MPMKTSKSAGTKYFFFFFQAEDGIRDLTVTGVQTCALPICARLQREEKLHERLRCRLNGTLHRQHAIDAFVFLRHLARRVDLNTGTAGDFLEDRKSVV